MSSTRIKVFEDDGPSLTVRASQSREGKGQEPFPFEAQSAVKFIIKSSLSEPDDSTGAVTYSSTGGSPAITVTTSTGGELGEVVIQMSSSDITSFGPSTVRAKLRVTSTAGNTQTLRMWAMEILDA